MSQERTQRTRQGTSNLLSFEPAAALAQFGGDDPTGALDAAGGDGDLAFSPQPEEQVEPAFTQEMSGPGATGANVAYGNTQGNQGMRLDKKTPSE